LLGTLALESTIDVIDNISSLPEPLTPEPATRMTIKTTQNIAPTTQSNRSDSRTNTMPILTSLKTTIDRSVTSNDHSANSVMPSGLSIDHLRDAAQRVISEESAKTAPKLTISCDLNTGERYVTNGNAVSARNLSLMNNLDFTPTNSGSDTESVGDVNDTKVDDNHFTYDDIRSARLQIITINNKSVHLIYYREEFYFSYEDLNNIFEGVELWNLIV